MFRTAWFCIATLVPTLAAASEVWVVELNGALGPAKADFIARTIDDAQSSDVEALVIRMDTPGGLDASMRSLVKAILAADLPIVTYVAPNGSRAASAGTYIAYASHIAAMAPATNIGSSTPVSLGGPPQLPDMAPEEDGADSKARTTPQDPMTRKVVNDAVAYLKGLAELRGRNSEWAEQTVRTGANIHASEALALGVIDLIAPDLPTLLREISGRSVQLNSGTHTLATDSATVVSIEADWQHALLEIITDPTIAYALLIFGVWGIVLELYSPGVMFPSIIGIVCLLLGAYGLQMLPVNYAGLALIVVGIAFMVAEAVTPALGIFGIAGLAAFIFGSFILMETDSPQYQIPLSIIVALGVTCTGLMIFVVGFAVRAQRQRVVSGIEAMIGAEAIVSEAFTAGARGQQGKVRLMGESWIAWAESGPDQERLEPGDRVRVDRIDGLELHVKRELNDEHE